MIAIYRKNEVEEKKTFGVSERAQNGFVAERVFSALHDEGEPVVDALMCLLLQPNSHTTNINK